MQRVISRKDALSAMARPIDLIFCYARSDETYLQELKRQLRPLERAGLLCFWDDRMILPGSDYKQAIEAHLDAAQLIVLLVSGDFLASDYCYDIELKRALERRERNEAEIIPLILRPCLWQDTPLGPLKALPTNGQPIIDPVHGSHADYAWKNVAEGIKAVAKDLQIRSSVKLSVELAAPPSAPPMPRQMSPEGEDSQLPGLREPAPPVVAIEEALQAFSDAQTRSQQEPARASSFLTHHASPYKLLGSKRVQGAVTGLVLAVNGEALVSSDLSGALSVGDRLAANYIFRENPRQPFHSLALSKDEQTLAVGYTDGTISIHHLRRKAEETMWKDPFDFMAAFMQHESGFLQGGHAGEVRALALNNDGSVLVSGGENCALVAWDADSNRSIHLGSYQGTHALLVLARHGQMVIGANEAGKISKWSMPGQQIQGLGEGISSDPMRMTALALSTDESILAWSDQQGSLHIYKSPFQDVSSRSGTTLSGQMGEITHLALSDDGSALLCAGRDNTIKVWNLATFQSIDLPCEHIGRVTALAFKGDTLACGDDQGTILVWQRE